MVAFRDRLRRHGDDRRRYETAKPEPATRTWKHVQDHADARSEVIRRILVLARDTTEPPERRDGLST